MKKKKVLVFPCGSEIGLEIHNALKYSTNFVLYGASSVSNHGEFVYENYVNNVPNVDDPDFISILNKIVKENEIDFIFPAHDSVVLKLAENAENFSCKIVGSDLETCRISRSKKATYDFFRSVINTPLIFRNSLEVEEFPVFLKPDVGQGSRGTYIANSREDIDFFIKKDSTLLILEYLPGKEYTVDCFTDRNGRLLFSQARERGRISGGISVRTFPVECDRFFEIAQKINGAMKFRGAWFFQLKENANRELVLLETAPRIAGSMALYRNLGVNFPLLSLFDALDMDIYVAKEKYDIVMDRALFSRFNVQLEYEHIYVDLDDTIVFDGKINFLLIGFLFQCFNKGIKLHLLSRHKARFGEETIEYLKKYRIGEIFDSVIDVKNDEKKSEFIKEKKSIFIDDSFSERRNVREMSKIPVFDLNSIESLINWRQ